MYFDPFTLMASGLPYGFMFPAFIAMAQWQSLYQTVCYRRR